MNERHVEVPVGGGAERWRTIRAEETVLLVAHNVTTVTRLLDVVPAFENDARIQLVFTLTEGDPFQDGVREAIEHTGIIPIPWQQATRIRFRLAISASQHGELRKLRSPLVIISHGIGYTKYSPGKPGSREAGKPGSREAGKPGSREVFGLSAEWVLRRGKPFAAALVLAHQEELRRLTAAAPKAAATAVVAGDPCYDRILASLPFRERYRAALGADDRTVVLVSSTWSETSLLGRRRELLRELTAELDRDRFLVTIALHPNIRHGHGTGQIQRWYADCARGGLVVLPEFDGWRAGLVAADVVIGDFGSVTGYGAAIGRPAVLAAFDDVPPDTAISALGAAAPRLPAHGPYEPVLRAAIEGSDKFASVAELASSLPGGSLDALRTLFYRLLGLDRPATDVAVEVVPAIGIAPLNEHVFADEVAAEVDPGRRIVRLLRRPAEAQRRSVGLRRANDTEVHLSCSADYPVRTLLRSAAVVCTPAVDVGADPDAWFDGVFRRHSSCRTAAVLHGDHCVIRSRDGHTTTLAAGAPGEALASAAHAWHTEGLTLTAGDKLTVDLGNREWTVTVR